MGKNWKIAIAILWTVVFILEILTYSVGGSSNWVLVLAPTLSLIFVIISSIVEEIHYERKIKRSD